MLLDVCLLAVSDEAAGLDRSESMAVGMSDPLGLDRATGQANTAVYVTPPPGGPSCQLPTAAGLPVTDEVVGRGADPAAGAGCLLVGSFESPELASSSALCLAVCWLDGCWGALSPPPSAVLRLLADTTASSSCVMREPSSAP